MELEGSLPCSKHPILSQKNPVHAISLTYTVKPVFNGIPRDHKYFPLWASFRLMQVSSN
jgi:hypothetical protein